MIHALKSSGKFQNIVVKINTVINFDSLCSAEHFRYENHGCQEHYKKDFKVPVCPVCSEPVAFERGISFDITVNRHIESNCRKINQKPIYTNACFFQQCKKKELIPFKCSTCSKNFCLKHRHADIHKCKENSYNNQRTFAA